MLLLPIALLAAQAVPVDQMPDDIVVIGQRLAHWTGKYQIRGSRMKCATKTSTGDPEIDAIGCEAFETCANVLAPRITASDDKALATEVRLAMKAGIKHDLSECVADKRVEFIAALADRRARRE